MPNPSSHYSNDTSFGWDPHAAIAGQSANRDVARDPIGHVASFFIDFGVRFWNITPDPGPGVSWVDPGNEFMHRLLMYVLPYGMRHTRGINRWSPRIERATGPAAALCYHDSPKRSKRSGRVSAAWSHPPAHPSH